MKTLLTSTALVAMLATGAAANTLTSTDSVYWRGNTGDNDNIDKVQCTFSDNVEGVMTYNESNKTWTTTSDATVKVLVRNGYADTGSNTGTSPFDLKYALDYIKVEPVKKDGTTKEGSVYEVGGNNAEYDAKVLYDNTGVLSATPSGWTAVTATVANDAPDGRSDTITVEDPNGDTTQSGYVTLSIGGTAELTGLGANDVLDANADYKVRHLVTCMQNGTNGPWADGVDTDLTN